MALEKGHIHILRNEQPADTDCDALKITPHSGHLASVIQPYGFPSLAQVTCLLRTAPFVERVDELLHVLEHGSALVEQGFQVRLRGGSPFLGPSEKFHILSILDPLLRFAEQLLGLREGIAKTVQVLRRVTPSAAKPPHFGASSNREICEARNGHN